MAECTDSTETCQTLYDEYKCNNAAAQEELRSVYDNLNHTIAKCTNLSATLH